MTQIINTHRGNRKRIFLSLFFLQTNKNKTSMGGYLTCKSDMLHIYSILAPRASDSLKSNLEDSLLKALNHLNLRSLTLWQEQVNAIRKVVENQK